MSGQKICGKPSYKNFIIIFFLGISSGLPLALVLSTLKASLFENGFDIKTIGIFSLVSLPYTLKFCFAPVIDSCSLPFLTKHLGQRRSWIIFTQIILAFFIFAVGLAVIENDLGKIALFSFLVALASASQDVVIDGYRIELIAKENQGLAAGFYVYGYRIGMLISGAGALVLAGVMNWGMVYFIMSYCSLLMALVTIFATETRRNFQQKSHDFISWCKNSIITPFVDFSKQERWYIILLFIIFFKLGDAFAGNLTLPFLLDLGFSKNEISSIVKTFGLFATLVGVFIGGVLVKKIGITRSLWLAAIMQMLSNLAFSYLSQIGHNPLMLYLVIFIENLSGGIGDAVFIAYLSGLCSIEFSATQYALLSSLASFSRSVLTSSSGIFAKNLGWYDFFILSTLLALPGLILLSFLTKRKKSEML